MIRTVILVLVAMVLPVSGALPAAAQVSELQILTVEQELERVCEKLDETAQTQTDIVRASAEKWQDNNDVVLSVQSHVSRTGRALQSQGRLSAADFETLVAGGLASHADPQVQGLIDLMAQLAAFSEDAAQARAEIEALIERQGLEIARLRQRKEGLKDELEKLRNSRPTPSIIETPEPDLQTEEEFQEYVELLNALYAQIATLGTLQVRTQDRLDDVSQGLQEFENEADLQELQEIWVRTGDTPSHQHVAGDGDSDLLETDLPAFTMNHVHLDIGTVNEPDLVFPGFGQGLLTGGSNWVVTAGFQIPLSQTQLSGWQTYWTGSYSHVEMDQNNHVNIATGAPGPSAGSVSFDYVGAGLAAERTLPRFGRVGFGVGIGGLMHDVSGSFRASGTTPAARLDAYLLYGRSGRLSAGPFVSAIVPFGDVSGGAGALTSRFQADPLFLFGLRVDLGLGR